MLNVNSYYSEEEIRTLQHHTNAILAIIGKGMAEPQTRVNSVTLWDQPSIQRRSIDYLAYNTGNEKEVPELHTIDLEFDVIENLSPRTSVVDETQLVRDVSSSELMGDKEIRELESGLDFDF